VSRRIKKRGVSLCCRGSAILCRSKWTYCQGWSCSHRGVAVLQRFSEEEWAPRQSPSEAQFEENGPVMVAAG